MTDDAVELTSEFEDLAQAVADQSATFLLALREIAVEGDRATAVPLLLLEVSQLLFAGARLGVQVDFVPREEFEPDAGPDPDLDIMRERLAVLLEGVDDFTEVFDPYIDPPELVSSRLSDDLADIASSVAHGLQHYRAGSTEEALWWWQFSYVSSWGAEASASLRALQSVIAHDRLDAAEIGEIEAARVAAAEDI
ncbi:MAG: hypothetical protein QOK30_1823 [Nocardioidaceae bacterium]|jgi:hypothetical protein|nr:hypothetical protein [Nocardioidaceae bacterium]MDX6366747.1 hypothetical protein [Nocardioidaceae bacterium]